MKGMYMEDHALDDVVQRLLGDRRFLRRFRHDPEGTLSRYGLSRHAIEAVKRGDADELLALGLSPQLVWPGPGPESGTLRRWLLRRGHALSPVAFATALFVAFPVAAGAAPPPARRIAKSRASRRISASNRHALYPHALYPHKRSRLAS
jgi:hypothetical protein